MGNRYELAGEVLNMRGRGAFAGLPMGAAALLLPVISHAQTTIPDTPPELRDFRLDPQNAPPRETTTQPVTPPPVAPTVEPRTTAPAQDTSRTEQPVRRDRPVPEAQQNPEPTAASDQSQSEPVVSERENGAPVTETPAEIPSAPVAEAAPADTLSAFPLWVLWVALAVAMLAIAAFFLRRRSRRRLAEYDPADDPVRYEPVTEPAREPAFTAGDATETIPAAPVAIPQPAIGHRPRIAVSFQPSKAVVSLANLTVSGQLHVINEGDVPAEGLKLRVALTSARQNQAEIIAAFHSDAPTFPAEPLGEARPGEHLELAVDLQVPLAELQSFPVGTQRLFVPMVIANVAYGWDGAEDVDVAEIACLIGREASPPQPKMGPLRLDLGPRSFDGLGQRPLAA